MEVPDARASLLPDDLLLDIFRRLEASDVISCAGTCKPWRRAIIGNAASLVPRLDMFVPRLLFGFVTRSQRITNYNGVRLQRTPPPASQPVPVTPEPEPKEHGYSMVPAPSNCDLREGLLLCTRDGFLLIRRRCDGASRKRKKPRRRDAFNDLCLWNPVTGACTFLPRPAAAWFHGYKTYILLTGYDVDDESDVRILAVQGYLKSVNGSGCRGMFGFRYQVFTATSGAWGRVVNSQELPERFAVRTADDTEVVCRGGVVHWLAWTCTCTVALDVRTGRTWTTALPLTGLERSLIRGKSSVVLATSSDGRRLSVIKWSQEQQQIQMWVLTGGGDRWTLRPPVVNLRELVPGMDGQGQHLNKVKVRLNVFCPRSGCLCVSIDGQELVVDVVGGSAARPIQLDPSWTGCHPYEMDWSSYWTMCLSNMKHF